MKILHIHPSLSSGGIEAMICGLANEMSKTDDVTVCSIFEPKATDVFLHMLSKHVKIITCHKVSEGFSLTALAKIVKIIKQEEYDVVNMHGFMYYYIPAIVLSLFSRTKFFYTVHSSAELESGIWDIKLLEIKKFLFQKGLVHPITISGASRESFINFYKTDSKLICNGISTPIIGTEDLAKPYRITNKTIVFVHPGRITKAKNQLVLCRAFKKLIDEGKDIILLIAGGADDNNIYSSIRPYFGERIVYLGLRHDIPQLMACCDAMCLPSIWEGLPITLLEALAVGCIPICSPVGGIVNVISDSKNGILSSSSSEEDYYKAITRFLSLNEHEKCYMKECGKQSFEKYKIENCAQDYLKYYKNILR